MKSLKFKIESIDSKTFKPLHDKMRKTTFRALATELEAKKTPLSLRTITTFFSKRRGSPRTLRIISEHFKEAN